MKIEKSCATATGVKKLRVRLRRIPYLLFLVTAVAAVVGAFASPYANQGGSTGKPGRCCASVTALKAMANPAEGAKVGNALPANVIVVTNTNDSGPGSLRQALADANDGDTIDATGVSGTILLTSGELQITHNVTINGPGAGTLAVNGSMTFRVFENFASNVTISGLTITNGLAPGVNGGGILNHGGLSLNDSIVSNSHSDRSGGGIFIGGGGTLTVTNSTISGNGAGGTSSAGGGICNADGATLTVIDSTISGNGATLYGGGIASGNGQLTVMNSTISSNAVLLFLGGRGGGMFLATGSATITDSTISDNRGEGILNSGAATQIKDTVLNAGFAGGTIFNDGGTVTSLGYNLASDNGGGVLTGPGDQINTDPLLGPLQNNGGPTFTHALSSHSPAINAGDPSFTPPPFFDQRGPNFVRVFGGRIDIGSFECQGRCPDIPRPRPTPAPRP